MQGVYLRQGLPPHGCSIHNAHRSKILAGNGRHTSTSTVAMTEGVAEHAQSTHLDEMSYLPNMRWTYIALSALPVIATAFAGNAVTIPKIAGWYAALVKPSFNPPNWLFGPVWTVLFAMMAYAVFRIWRVEEGTHGRTEAISLFYIQLLLNAGWSIAFFGLESPLLGMGVIMPLLGMILVTIQRFSPLDRTAGLLLVPYAAWVSFAALLNASIWWLNN